MTTLICAVPKGPHLNPVFVGVAARLSTLGLPHRQVESVQALWADRALMEQATVVLGIGGMPWDAARMDAAPRLHSIVSCVSGTDGIDAVAATARGILVAHAPTEENVGGMAESAVLLMLALVHDLDASRAAMGAPAHNPNIRARALRGKTIGLIGWGRIAATTAELLRPFGVTVLVHSRHSAAAELPPHVQAANLQALMVASDVVCMLASPMPGQPPLVGAAELAWMRPDACYINLSRGATTDEVAVADALRAGRLAAAALDVFAVEPLPKDSPLWGCPNLMLTPHRVGHTREAYASLGKAAIDNTEAVAQGRVPRFVRNPEVLAMWQQRMLQAAS